MGKPQTSATSISDNFSPSIAPYWTQVSVGGGKIIVDKSKLRVGFESASSDQYTDAQIDDYTMLSRSHYLWKPPLRMTVRARFLSKESTKGLRASDKNALRGTAGFGFWNNPFSLKGDVHALPEAIWFFYSAHPANVALVPEVAGWGWKAQSLHTKRPGLIAHIIPTFLAVLYARLTGHSSLARKKIQNLAAASEAPIRQDMYKWHTYILEWQAKSATFWIDGEEVLQVKQPPTQPLGFVLWLDNQYAVATPEGIFEFGKVDTGPQWLDIDSIKIEKL